MKIRRLFRTAYITGAAVFMLAAIARASTIEIDTGAAGAGTGFAGSISPLMLDSSTGDATLTFESTSGEFDSPTNIDLGDFVLGCVSCATTGASFAPFTFDLVLTDLTDNDATGEFLGASSGGTVTDDSSTITIAWSPSQLGPGTNNAMGSSDFGASEFTIDGSTGIVALIPATIRGNRRFRAC